MNIKKLADDGYFHISFKPNGRLTALYRFLFTTAIITDFDETGYFSRWCYHTQGEAKKALDEWNGAGEPDNWHRALLFGEPIRKRSKGRILTEK